VSVAGGSSCGEEFVGMLGMRQVGNRTAKLFDGIVLSASLAADTSQSIMPPCVPANMSTEH